MFSPFFVILIRMQFDWSFNYLIFIFIGFYFYQKNFFVTPSSFEFKSLNHDKTSQIKYRWIIDGRHSSTYVHLFIATTMGMMVIFVVIWVWVVVWWGRWVCPFSQRTNNHNKEGCFGIFCFALLLCALQLFFHFHVIHMNIIKISNIMVHSPITLLVFVCLYYDTLILDHIFIMIEQSLML